MIRSLYARILLWFWISNVAVTAAILSITLLSGAQPIGQRWLSTALDLYARTATDIYLQSGPKALDAYLDRIQSSVSLSGALVGPNGEAVSSHPAPAGTAAVRREVQSTGVSRSHFGLIWTGASLVPTPQGNYLFLARVDAVRRFSGQIVGGRLASKAAAALLAGCLLCWMLARSITAPLRTLQNAARSLGEGDLSVRVSPKIPPRNDELAELAHEFDRMAGEIESLRDEQHRLLADISHELRSPLTRLAISTELASRGDAESLDRMRKDITKLDQLIEQILTLTRLEVQQQTRGQGTVALERLLTGLVDDADFEAREQGKSVTLVAQPASVRGEAGLLRSCMENVIRNAIRYTPVASSVRVVLEKKQSVAVVTVRDSGRGVPEELLQHIFEPFYRVSSTAEDASGDDGSGLGLSISQRIVTLYGGSIRARNQAGGGLVVVIELPLAS